MSTDAERYREFMKRGGVADLSDRVMLTLTGADRVRYLNGQVTTNVQALRVGETSAACVTTAKGRLCAEIVITASADALLIDADPKLRDTLAARLERYIVADDVTLAEMPAETRLLHFIGTRPSTLGERPLHAARRFGRDGWDFWTDASALAELRPAIAAHHVALDEPLLETLRIEAGIPRWGRELDEDTLPPEAGLERTHIDYQKGCYIGQEVISRLKSIGHVNRRLVGFVSTTGAPLTAGSAVVSPGDPGTPLGRITSVTWSFALERPIALGYLKRSAPAGDLLADVPVAVRELPFTT